jgi:prolipoprotein diacylglyceryltransferase
MQFPVYLHIGAFGIHPHRILEGLAYLVGFRLFLRAKARDGDPLPDAQRWWIVTAAIAGAAVGSKLLSWLGDPLDALHHWNDPIYLMMGKTIVGGLLGGTIAVEWTKRRIGVTRRTGDLFALPLCAAIAIGRVGCFLSGLGDHTFGVATTLPWGVDFGDGVHRHPTQLYEIAWLALLAIWLRALDRSRHRDGDLFRAFMVGYLAFRLAVDFIKPGVALLGLTTIQWACVAALVYYARDLPWLLGWKRESTLA